MKYANSRLPSTLSRSFSSAAPQEPVEKALEEVLIPAAVSTEPRDREIEQRTGKWHLHLGSRVANKPAIHIRHKHH